MVAASSVLSFESRLARPLESGLALGRNSGPLLLAIGEPVMCGLAHPLIELPARSARPIE